MQPRSSRILNNHQYTKEELIKNNNITSAIFPLDQKVEPLEFLDRLKAVALEFNKLTDNQKMILKHWIGKTVDETIVEDAVKILESNKEGVEKMAANNAFIIEEMKEKVKKEVKKEGLKETILDNLKELGNVTQNLIEYINKQENMNILKY